MKKLIAVFGLTLSLYGCGGGSSSDNSPPPQEVQNSPPVANAGNDQNASTGTVVTLNGSASSDAEGDTLSYTWSLTSFPSGSNASLTNPTNVSPTFTADVDGTYVAQLIVNDGTVDSAADTVSVIAATANSAPVANAGNDQNASTGTVVTLNGSASSDADGDTLSYTWSLTSLPSGSSASLTSPTNVSPTFTADVDGTYVAQLIVNDGTVDSAADTVSVIAATANSAPVANAGNDQNASTGTVVTLNGSASSDADGDTLSYNWSLTSLPSGSSASLTSPTNVSPTFTADVDGTYVAQLIVNDGTVDSAADTVSVIAATANSAPVANAGNDQNASTGTVVTLNGSASSDADGDTLSYTWSLTSFPSGSNASLTNPTNVSPTFTVDVDGTYVAQLIVNDGTVDSAADTVSVIAATANSAPVANAGNDQNVMAGTTVYLDGSGSTDADGDGLLYSWSFVSKPTGSLSTFDDETTVNPGFTPDLDGSYVISLIVNDGIEDSEPDTLTVDAVQPSVKLFRESGFFDPVFSEVPLPYSSNSTVTANVTGIPTPTTYTLDTFRIVAEAQSFTIINLTATDGTGQVVPTISNLSEGLVLADGVEVEFELVSPLTGGATVTLNYGFEIQETGETFSARYTFTSN
ncbi:PKD domain-containing protein [Alteromonas macleodii]|uniref:PKD domain-containing protein n=1 Tax=Alteromonas macleodii TaxID=28108 RepID=UPI00313DE077